MIFCSEKSFDIEDCVVLTAYLSVRLCCFNFLSVVVNKFKRTFEIGTRDTRI